MTTDGPAVPVIGAFYYPGYHATAERDVRGGTTEWPLLFDDVARAAYPNARRPAAGPVATDAASLVAEAALANAHGIGAFLWCWYWDRGTLHFDAALQTYLKAPLPAGFRYALLWANKRPHFRLPLDARAHGAAAMNARVIDTDEADWRAMHAHLIANHWRRPDYLKVDGRPVWMVFLVEPLVRRLGPRRLGRMLADGERMARDAGLPGVHYVAVMHRLNESRRWLRHVGLGRRAGEASLRRIGFRAVTSYLLLPAWDGPPIQYYDRLIDERIAEWPRFEQRYELPYYPTLSPGWDARVRGVPISPEPPTHPWAPRVVGETPAAFGRLLDGWRAFAATRSIPLLPVASWNEWTEGHAIAPCDRHGDGFLRQLKAFAEATRRDGQRDIR